MTEKTKRVWVEIFRVTFPKQASDESDRLPIDMNLDGGGVSCSGHTDQSSEKLRLPEGSQTVGRSSSDPRLSQLNDKDGEGTLSDQDMCRV